MKVKYIYSACLEVETQDLTILMDPWFTDGIYDGSWYQFPKIDPFDYITKPDVIYISHIHPDHYDPKFLQKLFKKFGEIPIYIPDLKSNLSEREINTTALSTLTSISGSFMPISFLRLVTRAKVTLSFLLSAS